MSSPPPDPGAPAVPGPATPLDAITACELTAQIRASIAAVERAGALPAARVRRAHQSHIRRALGYASWAGYPAAEFEIGVEVEVEEQRSSR
ncbi:hypothetical protein ABZV14_40980 [Streptosporangium canum]|uniref:hypothetical protein n=1 Tax=Streptosporangium canum TaxID=324952 RepID=UPI0033A2DB69